MLNQRPYTLDKPALAEKALALMQYAENGGRDVRQLLALASTLWRLSQKDKEQILRLVSLHVLAEGIIETHKKKIQASNC